MFRVYGAVAAGGRFCGLKAALLSLSLNGYGLVALTHGVVDDSGGRIGDHFRKSAHTISLSFRA